MLRLAAYARVSTDEQSSLDAQLATLVGLAERLGGVVVATETDVMTGFNNRRPGYNRILDMARRREIDGVLVYKLDRFGRDHAESIGVVHELESKLGVRVYSATEPVDDPFVRDLLLLLANREVRVLSERVKMMQRSRARDGQWTSRPPTGYLIKKTGSGASTFTTLAVDPIKAPLVKQVFEAAAEGNHSVRELRDLAHAIGLTSSSGHELTRPHMHKLLTNPVYQGDAVYGRQANGKFEPKRNRARDDWTIVENAHPAIVDRATFAAVQAAFVQHRRIPGDVRKTKWFLTSLVFCGHCGSRMYGASHGRGKNGVEHYSYMCQRHASYGSCEQKVVGGMTVDAIVRDEISRFVVTEEVRLIAEQMVREQETERAQDADAQRRNLLRARQRHERERLDLAEGYITRGKGTVPFEVYTALDNEKAQAITIIDRTLATLEEVRPLDISGEMAALEGARWELVQADDPLWRGAAVLLIERVTLRRGDVKGKPRVEISWTPAAAVIREAVAAAV